MAFVESHPGATQFQVDDTDGLCLLVDAGVECTDGSSFPGNFSAFARDEQDVVADDVETCTIRSQDGAVSCDLLAGAEPPGPATQIAVVQLVDGGGPRVCILDPAGAAHCVTGADDRVFPGPFEKLALTPTSICLLDSLGTIECFGAEGENEDRELGSGRAFTNLYSSGRAICALDVDDRLTCWPGAERDPDVEESGVQLFGRRDGETCFVGATRPSLTCLTPRSRVQVADEEATSGTASEVLVARSWVGFVTPAELVVHPRPGF